MTLSHRPYQTEDDFWRIRAFLREVFLLNDRHEYSWQAARLDYWRWHVVLNCEQLPNVEEYIHIWETAGGTIRAVLTPEGVGEAFLHVHPAHRTAVLEAEMLRVAEREFATTTDAGQCKLHVWAHEHDTLRHDVLRAHGYTQTECIEYQRQRTLDTTIPDGIPAPGYTIRALGDVSELPSRSWASWRAFHPNEPDEAYRGWEWYHNIQRHPMYRRDLDIVAVAPDGEIAGFCTLWFDDVTRTGFFEPVGVNPDHQRRGLATAVMCEAMRRIKRMGATHVTVAGFSGAANATYQSVMGTEPDHHGLWVKEW